MPYNPSQPRAPKGSTTGGQWTTGGFWGETYDDDEETLLRSQDLLRQDLLNQYCKRLGYTGRVTYVRDQPEWEDPNKTVYGDFNIDTESIRIYGAAFEQREQTVGGILSHEIMHRQIQRNYTTFEEWVDDNRSMDGDYLPFLDYDGMTPYSTSWWDSVKDASFETRLRYGPQAINETLCEVARLDFDGQADRVDPFWMEIYHQLKGDGK